MDCFAHAVAWHCYAGRGSHPVQYPRFAAVSAVHHDMITAGVDNMLNHLDSEALSLQESKSERTL